MPNIVAKIYMKMEYTAAGIAMVVLAIIVSAIVMAKVLLWIPISNAHARAWYELMPNIRGTKYPTIKLIAQNSAVDKPICPK